MPSSTIRDVSVVVAETAFAPSAADASKIHLNPRMHSLPCGT
jgi:hypothetical protein